jgi:formylglycine-generating enzyme required for sulfatase activity
MSDIFISYKREEQDKARQLADALEKQGWSVWWDPKLRAGDYFDDVIEKALNEARCVIVLWSKRSVQSRYVRDESSYALTCGKLVPVAIEEVELPFRFRGIHTPPLIDWDGSEQYPTFVSLVDDIVEKLGQPAMTKPASAVRPADEEQLDGVANKEKMTLSKQTSGPGFSGSKGSEMLFVSGGDFEMGSDPATDPDAQGDEQPRHRVQVKDFYIGKYEVTFDQYGQYAKANNLKLPDDSGFGRGKRPVINISWNEAASYAKWLGEQTGKKYRLPTEAEWEYAARAGKDTKYWWGNDIRQDGKVWANCDGCGSQWDKTAPVGQFPANAFGLHDTAGNVWEWVQDCWHNSYKGDSRPDDGSAWGEADGGDCSLRVIRGGSWDSGPGGLRSATRSGFNAGTGTATSVFVLPRTLSNPFIFLLLPFSGVQGAQPPGRAIDLTLLPDTALTPKAGGRSLLH